MIIGTLTSLIANQHIGVLKKYGYPTNMLDANGVHAPASIDVTDVNLLQEKQIELALEAGVIVFEPVEPSEEQVQTTEIISLTEEDLTETGQELLQEITLVQLIPTDEEGNSLTEEDLQNKVESNSLEVTTSEKQITLESEIVKEKQSEPKKNKNKKQK